MARNKFDVDERLESPFRLAHLKRAGKYIAKHKYKMIAALLLSAMSSVASLFIPKITQWVLDDAVPNKDTAMIGRMALLFVGIIALGILFTSIRSRMMAKVSQQIIDPTAISMQPVSSPCAPAMGCMVTWENPSSSASMRSVSYSTISAPWTSTPPRRSWGRSGCRSANPARRTTFSWNFGLYFMVQEPSG